MEISICHMSHNNRGGDMHSFHLVGKKSDSHREDNGADLPLEAHDKPYLVGNDTVPQRPNPDMRLADFPLVTPSSSAAPGL